MFAAYVLPSLQYSSQGWNQLYMNKLVLREHIYPTKVIGDYTNIGLAPGVYKLLLFLVLEI